MEDSRLLGVSHGHPGQSPQVSAIQLEAPLIPGEVIQIFAPTGNDGRLTVEFLARAGLHAEVCHDAAELCSRIDAGCGAVLLAEEALDAKTIAALSAVIIRQPSWSDILMVIITSRTRLNSTRLRHLTAFGPAGNVTFIERPFHPETLVSAFQVALRSRRRQYQVRDLLQEREQNKAELEAIVAARTAELQATVASLESLLYSIAHDLRSPLRAMQGFATALEHDYQAVLDETGREFTRRISLAAIRLDALTMDLLSFGQIANTEISLVCTKTREVVGRALEQLQAEIEVKRAQIDVVDPLADTWANPIVLQQIVTNLLANALKYVARGEVPRVRIWTQAKHATIRLCVQDRGIGIDPRYHSKVFRLFERLHRTAEYAGTGIGLAIVQKGVEKMGGTVGVESELGQGSTFWVELPIPK